MNIDLLLTWRYATNAQLQFIYYMNLYSTSSRLLIRSTPNSGTAKKSGSFETHSVHMYSDNQIFEATQCITCVALLAYICLGHEA